MRIDVLGTSYEVLRLDYGDDPCFEQNGYDGYCDVVRKRLVVCTMQTYPTLHETEAFCRACETRILRHELIHAFLSESGLCESTHETDARATNEEMVDWLAIQMPKLVRAMKEAGCLEG